MVQQGQQVNRSESVRGVRGSEEETLTVSLPVSTDRLDTLTHKTILIKWIKTLDFINTKGCATE